MIEVMVTGLIGVRADGHELERLGRTERFLVAALALSIPRHEVTMQDLQEALRMDSRIISQAISRLNRKCREACGAKLIRSGPSYGFSEMVVVDADLFEDHYKAGQQTASHGNALQALEEFASADVVWSAGDATSLDLSRLLTDEKNLATFLFERMERRLEDLLRTRRAFLQHAAQVWLGMGRNAPLEFGSRFAGWCHEVPDAARLQFVNIIYLLRVGLPGVAWDALHAWKQDWAARKLSVEQGAYHVRLYTWAHEAVQWYADRRIQNFTENPEDPARYIPLAEFYERGDRRPPALVGRQRALAQGQRFLDGVRRGQGGLLLITGVAGVGKTVFTESLCPDARARGIDLWGMVDIAEGLAGYDVWHRIFRPVWEQALFQADVQPSLVERAPAIRGFLLGDKDHVAYRGDTDSALAEQVSVTTGRQLARDLFPLVEYASAKNPLIIVLENVHEMGIDACATLIELQRLFSDTCLGIIATLRDEELASDNLLRNCLESSITENDLVSASCSHIQLAPFDDNEMVDYLDKVLGIVPDVRRVHQAKKISAGIPLVLTAYGGDVVTDLPLRAEGVARNTGLHELLAPVLRRVPKDVRVALEAAALVSPGMRIDTERAAILRGLTSAVFRALLEDEAVRERVIHGHSGEFWFVHALWKETLLALGEDTPGMRAQAFLVLQDRLEDFENAGETDRALLFYLADHAIKAGPAYLDEERIVSVQLKAARSCADRHEYADALKFLEHCLAFSVPFLSTQVLTDLGEMQQQLGEWKKARHSYWEALRTVQTAEQVEEQSEILLRLARITWDPGEEYERINTALEYCLCSLWSSRRYRARIQASLAERILDRDPAAVSRKIALAHAADEAASDLVDLGERASAFLSIRFALFGVGDPESTFQRSTAALDFAQRENSPDRIASARIARFLDLVVLGRFEGAKSELRLHQAVAGRTSAQEYLLENRMSHAMLEIYEGKWETLEHSLSYDEILRVLGPFAALSHVTQIMAIARGTGNRSALLGMIANAGARFTDIGTIEMWEAARRLFRVECGDIADSYAQLLSLLDASGQFRDYQKGPFRLGRLAFLAETCTKLRGHFPESEELVRLSEGIYSFLKMEPDQIVMIGWPGVLLGPLARYRGLAALGANDFTAALENFALARASAGPGRPMCARLQFDTACALQQLGNVTQARHMALGARREAVALGMNIFVEEVADFLVRLGPDVA